MFCRAYFPRTSYLCAQSNRRHVNIFAASKIGVTRCTSLCCVGLLLRHARTGSCRRDRHNILRPEALESLYYLYWITREDVYRDQAWAIFEAFEEHCRVDRGGYAGLEDVTDVSAPHSFLFRSCAVRSLHIRLPLRGTRCLFGLPWR